jgi:hypothetical protein
VNLWLVTFGYTSTSSATTNGYSSFALITKICGFCEICGCFPLAILKQAQRPGTAIHLLRLKQKSVVSVKSVAKKHIFANYDK